MHLEDLTGVKEVAKRIFECPNKKVCPVAKKFSENNDGELPIPEAYVGNSKAKFMIIGINPGQSKNYLLGANLTEYISEIEDFLEAGRLRSWQYEYAAEIFRYTYLDDVLITNLVHCPTPSWTRNPSDEWKLSNEEKKESIELCNQFCLEIIKEVDPEFILLHGQPPIEFFSTYYEWGIEEKKPTDINGVTKKGDGRTFVLSQHLQSIRAKKCEGAWKALEEASKRLGLGK